MSLAGKRLALGLGAGLSMSLIVWLFVSEASPAYSALLQQPEAAYVVLLLDLPALFFSRVVSGSPPSAPVVYLACFVQWFAIGFSLSFLIWRQPDGTGGAPQAERRDSAASSRPRR